MTLDKHPFPMKERRKGCDGDDGDCLVRCEVCFDAM